MVVIDLSKIKSDRESPNDAFEELICLLAQREDIEGEYRRIEGSGGDGGVEAVRILKNGSIIGYQAKYFLKTKDIDWSQIDKSVEQALETYPQLSRYVIAIACDLTGKRGQKVKGKSGWENWDTRKEKWNGWSKKKGMNVSFETWTASEINDRLMRENARGLRSYWFDEIEFTQKWFKEKLENSISNLRERYHPDDHVNVSSQGIISGLTRSDELYNEIDDLRSIDKLGVPESPSTPKLSDRKKLDHLKCTLKANLTKLRSISIVRPVNEKLPISDLDSLSQKIVKNIHAIREWCTKRIDIYENFKDIPYDLRKFDQDLDKLDRHINDFVSFLSSSDKIKADQTKFLFVTGRAGTGKSHLLAHLAKEISLNSKPILLFTGYDFSEGDISNQIISLCGLNFDEDKFFHALNCAGEADSTRAVIIIDAINEGKGAHFWYKKLPKFQSYLRKFPCISCIVSCRSEYKKHAIPDDVLDEITNIELLGFSTHKEQEEACKIYLDKRKIIRPATPWLNPEFTNPLFLRSAVVALKKEGKKEFPKGLRGISKLFKFYIDATSKHLTPLYAGKKELVSPVIESLEALANKILVTKNKDINFSEANNIINGCFSGKTKPEKETWLEALVRNGLLQRYPLYQRNTDPLSPLEEIISFSSERLQDHFVAKKLISQITEPKKAFDKNGAAEFIIKDSSDTWYWSGIITALSVLFPEKFGKELIDCVPDGMEKWWDYRFAQAFAESVRWRNKKSFTDRTRALLIALDDQNISSLYLLLDVGLSEDHPFNVVNFLSPELEKRALPERDSFWSYKLCHDGDFAIHRIIDWALDGASNLKGTEALKYASIILTWAFSTSNRVIRDNATKALTAVFLIEPSLFNVLAEKFSKIDDLYILERLYAAAYGAICQRNTDISSKDYSKVAYEHIFSSGVPPLNLKLRGYAKAIIDFAEAHNSLSNEINLSLVSPPYQSDPPQFGIDKDELKKLAETVGGREILHSCIWDDFGIYEIGPRTRVFLDFPLSDPPPILHLNGERSRELPCFELEQLKLWVAKKAYGYGWTKTFFPNDRSHPHISRERNPIERIGKKYQWLALSELQCRLADNYWLKKGYSETESKIYETPLDIGFERDIDPTILYPEKILAEKGDKRALYLMGKDINIGECNEDNLQEWPFLKNPSDEIEELVFRKDETGREYVVFYEHRSTTENYPEDEKERMLHGLRRQEFRFFTSVFLEKGQVDDFFEYFKKEQDMEFNHFSPDEYVDEAYLLESPWAKIWKKPKWSKSFYGAPDKFNIAKPLDEYCWEAHLDKSMPEGCSAYIPSSWLHTDLALLSHDGSHLTFFNDKDVPLFLSGDSVEQSPAVFFDKKTLSNYLDREGLTCVWLYLSERNAWPQGNNEQAAWRRIKGVLYWDKNEKIKKTVWEKNSKR